MADKASTAIISDTNEESEETAYSSPGKSLLWGNQQNLFNKKEFAEIKSTIDSIESLIETEKERNKKILAELNDIITKDREEKKERERDIRRNLQEVAKKINFISEQSTEKESQLKKEVDVLQQSIKMIQVNLSASRMRDDKKEGQADTAPTIVSREELEKLSETTQNIKAMLDEEKSKEKHLDKQMDEIVLQRDELIKGFELSSKKQIQRINTIINTVNAQTAEKEAQLKREIEILQQSIRLIKERLPIEDEPSSKQSFAPKQVPVGEPRYAKSVPSQPRYVPEEESEDSGLEIEVESGSEEGTEEDSPKKKRKFGKSFYLFGK